MPAVARPYAARSNRRYHCVPPGGGEVRRWEDQRMLSSFRLRNILLTCLLTYLLAVCRRDVGGTFARRSSV